MGPAIKPDLEKALAQAADAEQQARLKAILKGMSVPKLPPPAEVEFGSVRVSECRQLYEDGSGRAFVVAGRIDRDLPGVAIMGRDGKATALRGPQFAAGWETPEVIMNRLPSTLPILSASGHQIWLAYRQTVEAPKLLDLDKTSFVDTLPNPGFNELRAVSADGRLFVSAGVSIRSDEPILVYTPGARQTEPVLNATRVVLASPLVAVTDQGTLWADGTEGLARFDGVQWSPVAAKPQDRITSLLPGHGDMMLACDEKTATLYKGNQEVASGSFPDLIQQNRDLVRKAFGPGGAPVRVQYPGSQGHAITADRAGNIWCVQPSGRLLVYTGDRWKDTNEAMTNAGSREGLAATLALVGDGNRVHVNELRLRWGGGERPYFGEVREGKPVFTRMPDACNFGDLLRNIYDHDGALWVPAFRRDRGYYAYRIPKAGDIQEVADVGAPLMVDQAGNVWTVEIRTTARDQFILWRDGKVVQRLKIPDIDRERSFLFSDRRGSVYAWTTLGLQHLVADAPAFNQYRLDKRYAVEGLLGTPATEDLLSPQPHYAYSRYGYLAEVTYLELQDTAYHLYLIKLPSEGGKRPR